MKFKLVFGKSEKSTSITKRQLDWDELKGVLSKVSVRPGTRAFMMAGDVPNNVRAPVEQTQLLMLDLDSKNGTGPLSFDSLLWDLVSAFDYRFAAYTTRSYDGSNVHYRVIVPFAAPIDRGYHAAAVRHVLGLLPESVTQYFDGCSYRPDQLMFLPCVKAEGLPFESGDGGEVFFDPAALGLEADHSGTMVLYDDIEMMLASQPLDVSDEQVKKYLDMLDPSTLSYGGDEGVFGWVDVGMALAHQYQKSDKGLRLWVEWSRRNVGVHKDKGMRAKWRSFEIVTRGGRKGITFASVMAQVRDRGGLMAPGASSVEVLDDGDGFDDDVSVVDDLCALDYLVQEAEKITTRKEFHDLRDRVSRYDTLMLPKDGRQEIVHAAWENYGKRNGVTKKTITDVMAYTKKLTSGEGSQPLTKWMKGWYYILSTCEFYHAGFNKTIAERAFNALYDSEYECLKDGIRASDLALKHCKIPPVWDKVYWPGKPKLFENDGQPYINTYHNDGAQPSDAISDDGQVAIDLMLYHLSIIIGDERERTIVLDWLTYVYQNPGKRVDWAVMIQGSQGIGKSYIGQMMEHLLGGNHQPLDGRAISERFTGWAHGTVLSVIEEVRISGASKFDIVDRMKPFITNDMIQIEEKGRDHRKVPNFTNYLLFTNHKDAIPIKDDDRRYCVIYSDIQSRHTLHEILGGSDATDDHFSRLFNSTKDHADDFARFFLDRKISDNFNPNGRAPETKALAIIKSFSRSGDSDLLEDAIDQFDCDVICDNFVDITWLQSNAESIKMELPKTNTLTAILRDLGFEPTAERVWIKKTRRRHTVWFHPGKVKVDLVIAIVQAFHNKEKFNKEEFDRVATPFNDDDLPF